MVDKAGDIRWKQRFSNYTNAFEQLQEGVNTIINDYMGIFSKFKKEMLLLLNQKS
jgi:hypothetical protein